MPTKLIKCTCTNEAQDEMYGKGNRMANEMRTGQLKCTVCSSVHGSASLTSTTKAKAAPVASEKKTEAEKKPVEKKNDKKPDAKKKSLKGGKR